MIGRTPIFQPFFSASFLGVAAYYGYPDHRTLVVPQDPSLSTPTGYHSNKHISLWDNDDRMSISLSTYCDGVRAMKPTAFVALCDGDTPRVTSNKRVSKAVNRSLSLLDETLLDHEADRGPLLFAAVEGGYDEKGRRASARQVATRTRVDGYFLDGFHLNGEDALKTNMDDLRPILKETLRHLPGDQPKLYLGLCRPDRILDLVSMGVDMFDTSYAIHLSDTDRAFVFPHTLLTRDGKIVEPVHLDEGVQEHLNLSDSIYKEDFTPISDRCDCYTCQKHTRAYVHHLIMTKELLARILLTIHNLHYYGTFFRTIRRTIALDKFDLLKGIVSSISENKS